MNLRFTVDCLLTFLLIVLLQYVLIVYLDREVSLQAEDPLVDFLLQLVSVK